MSECKKKGPDNAGPLLGADNEIRIFEFLAITGLQLVKFLSTHKHDQKSHSFATFAKFRCILS